MQPLPHRYDVSARVIRGAGIEVSTAGAETLVSDAPPEFGGPEGLWSPETLLVGAVADCFAVTFRGVARASNLSWEDMSCEVAGTLDKVDGVTRFTEIDIQVRLVLVSMEDRPLAERVIDKAKRSCLVTNSMTATVRLGAAIEARTIGAYERTA